MSGVPVQECPGCRGIWVSSENVKRLGKSFNLDLNSANEKNPDIGLNCNNCGGSVRKVAVNTDADTVDLAECTSCKGVWFAHGELEKTKGLGEAVDNIFHKKRINRQRKKTVRKEKLSRVYRTDTPVAKESSRIRNQFIAKVYRLFLISLFSGVMGAGAGILLGVGYTYFWGLIAVELFILILALCVRRNKTWNMLALFSFTTFSGFSISPLLNAGIAAGQGFLIPITFGLTAVLFSALMYYAQKTKKDFSFMGGFFMSTLWVMVAAGIVGFFVPDYINTLIYCLAGIVLFSGFVIYDTSRIILKYDVTEYVSATLDLYLDFLNIFSDMYRISLEASDVSDFFDLGDLL